MNQQNKNIMVTGGAGFIGSTLVRELLNRKANVIVYDNFVSGHLSNLIDINDNIKIIKGDIRDRNFKEILIKNDIQILFNLAAHPYIPDCYDKPLEFFDVDATGALNVMLACKEAQVERILHYSTSEVYGTAQRVPMDENHPILPLSTYAVSKLAADRLCYTLCHEQNLPVIIMRQFNTYGPRETHPYIIPELITQLSKSNNLKLGNIKASRDLTYVTDAANAAIELIGCKNAIGEVVNVGCGEDYSVEQLAYIIAELMGKDNLKIDIEKERLRPLDVQRLNASYFKIHKLTGWMPKIKLKDGLQKTIEWFNENNQKWLWETTFGKEDEIWKARKRILDVKKEISDK